VGYLDALVGWIDPVSAKIFRQVVPCVLLCFHRSIIGRLSMSV